MTDSAPPARSGTLAPPKILAEIESDASAATGSAFAHLAAEYFDQTRDRAGTVSTPPAPSALAERFDEPLPRSGQPIEAVIDRLRSEIIPSSNHLWHPRYVGHQIAGPLPAAVWTESVTASLNQSLAVFEMSPVGTVLEHRVIGWMCELAGFPRGSGGTMTSGGTEATFTGLLAARGAALPDAWMNGVDSEPPLLVCGEHAHYAVTRAAGELGLGMRNVRVAPSRDFRMDPAALDSALGEIAASGRRTMAVVATAGSTATGSFDDLDAIASICERHGVWLHVDAAHGGSALLSARHRAQLRGIERARSIAWDPHKMMLLPSQAGMLLVRDERDLDAAFSQRAPYLFHGAVGDRAWDQGTRSFLCSRRADVLKLWVALQRHGADALGELYDYFCALTRYTWQEIGARDDFEALHEPEGDILCFRYVGDRTLGPDAVDAVNRELRERYNQSGAGWITGTVLGGRRVLRVTLMNPRTNQSDICAILDGLAAVGREIIG
jgi:glutamate/tyrosine decarboxylase-like PLP-dependent enzyme